MKLIFKPLLILSCLIFGPLTLAQGDGEWSSYYFDVLANGKIGFLVPNAGGENFLNNGYDSKVGFHVEAKVFINKKISLGLQYQSFKSDVTDPMLVGAIESSNIAHGFLLGQYHLLKRNSKWSLEVGTGVGFIRLRNKKEGFPRFSDSGFAVALMAETSYRLSKSIGAYIQFQNNWSFPAIKASNEIQDNFDSALVFSPSFGLKLYIL